MIHLGDITKLHGDAIPPVDCITGGSPCQDLSVAGKRAGLAGERSGLFMEQIRIVKEMRERDRRNGRTGYLVRPRYMVWENVPGAFSSNKGADFQAVLTEIVKIVEPDAPDVPLPDKGKWPHSGCLYSDMGDWSVAWRLHDAQFWGVPQRRKRIALVADFGGLAAPEVLFERESLSRDPEPRGAEGEEAAGSAGGGVDSTGWGWHNGTYYMDADIEADPTIRQQGDCIDSTYPTVARSLTQRYDGSPCIDRGPDVVVQNIDSVFCLQGNGIDRADTAGCNGRGWREDVSYTLNTIDRPAVMAFAQNQIGEVRVSPMSGTLNTNSNASGRNSPLVYDARGNGDGETAPTMTGDHQSRVTDYTALCVDAVQTYQEVTGTLNPGAHPGSYNGQDAYNDMLITGCYQNTGRGWWNESDVGATIRTPCGGDSTKANLVTAVDCRNGTENPDINGTLQAEAQGQNVNSNNVCRQGSVVRRLTPLECERLQGFPDDWTDIGDWVDSKGKKHKAADSPRYKALGNSIALPFWFWLLRRISAQYERPATLGSLFDGIGGFPLCWERCNGKGTAIWASEIEEFPIAVTKKHFPEEKEDT